MNDGDGSSARGERVLCLCPTRADAFTVRRLFAAAGLAAVVFEDAAPFCEALNGDTGVLVLSDEALVGCAAEPVRAFLAAQEAWSAIPLIVLTGALDSGGNAALGDWERYGQVTLLERPVSLRLLAGVVRMGVAARRQQYRVRDLLAERAEAIVRRDELLAMLGHELRNPLGAVSTCAEVMARSPDADHAMECARIVATQARDMKRLLDDLLDVSRLTLGRLVLQRQPADLGDILRQVVDQVGHRLDARGQRLDLVLPPGPLPVDADPTRLRQVFANLLNNASRYSPLGSAVDLTADVAAGQAIVQVRDRGEGMTPETLARLFEPFWQAGSRAGRGGLGIGLTLARRLVEMHGGGIEARSEGPGRGSEMTVRVPLAPRPDRAAAPAPQGDSDRGLRVLVIDDNRDLALGIRLLLGARGHRVALAHRGADGIAAALRDPPQVILLDVGLPDMDGFDVARRLRALPALGGVRLVGMSGFGGDDHRRRSEAAGMDLYLVKPVTAAALEQAITAAG